MNSYINEISTRIREIYDNEYVKIVDSHAAKPILIFDSVAEEFSLFLEKCKGEINTADACTYFIHFLTETDNRLKSIRLPGDSDVSSEFNNLDNQLLNYINEIPRLHYEIQAKERYYPTHSDGAYLKIKKFIKRSWFNISTSPKRIANLFRIILKKPKKEIKFRKHPIALKNLALKEFYFRILKNQIGPLRNPYLTAARIIHETNDFIHQLAGLVRDYAGQKISYNDLVSAASKLEPAAIRKALDDQRIESMERFRQSFDRNFNSHLSDFRRQYEICGTTELRLSRLSEAVVKKLGKEKRKFTDPEIGALFNSGYYSLEKIKNGLSIYTCLFLSLRDKIHSVTYIFSGIQNNVYPLINTINVELNGIRTSIEEKGKDAGDNISRARKFLSENITQKLIPELTELVLSQNLPEIIDEYELNLIRRLNTLPQNFIILRDNPTDSAIINRKAERINARDLIISVYVPSLIDDCKKAKNELIGKIQKISDDINSLDKIADYNLESALEAIESGGEDGSDTAIQGMDRAIQKAGIIHERMQVIADETAKKLGGIQDQFNSSLNELFDKDKALNLKLRATKTMATIKAKRLSLRFLTQLKDYSLTGLNLTKDRIEQARKVYSKWSKHFGFEKKKPEISSELYDFLADTEKSIKALPYAYQRLFRIAPLESDTFFDYRAEELSKISYSYEKWRAGSFAQAVIIGEKGNGTTSIINMFLKKRENTEKVIIIDPEKTISREEELIRHFNLVLGVTCNTMSELAGYLNSGEKKIIIMENIQNLFLRKVGGFDNLKRLLKLISKTRSRVFWLTSITIFAWKYLEKAINIDGHFQFRIFISKMSDKQINEIILKRHRISGYDLHFLPSEVDLQSKNYKKIKKDDERQDYLQKEYFRALNEFTKSNLSLAFIYWLRSAERITENTIFISSLKDLDYSFLKILGHEMLFLLHAILLHGKVSTEDISEIMNISLEKSNYELMILHDGGIIDRQNGQYEINPLIYRQIVLLLQSKNILY
ncbi:MAG: hypothetical protein ACLFR2_07295 [Candidatus Kapaibacterium sp.]